MGQPSKAPALVQRLQTWKGLVCIALTSLPLYLAMPLSGFENLMGRAGAITAAGGTAQTWP